MTTFGKRILICFSIITLLICVALYIVIRNADEILKSQLERFLGKDFRVERIVLNRGSADAYGVAYARDGKEVFHADHLHVSADLLGFVKRHYSVSGITIERPYIIVVIDKDGKLQLPFVTGQGKDGDSEKNAAPLFEISALAIKDGELHMRDERMPANRNSIDIRGLNLKMDNLTYPFADASSRLDMSAVSEGRIISGGLSAEGKVNLKTSVLDIRIKGKDIVLLDAEGTGPILSADSMVFSVLSRQDREGKTYTFDDVVIIKPRLRYETDPTGELASPWRDIIDGLQKAVRTAVR
ncbi:MAG TPA: DUF748 domain-containing protein [Dissulfurispiraceae bacterium]|nr:DUF748 domain-containing protein [Dissulfurispiraceae bacterium]